jgi:hypothetical protein
MTTQVEKAITLKKDLPHIGRQINGCIHKVKKMAYR